MMKLLLLACLVAVCSASAAPPAVPMVAETFCADGEIEFHASERTLFGKFVICRDLGKQLEMEGAEYSETKDIFRTLLIYNSTTSHMAYYVRGKFGGERCAPESRNVTSTLPPFFDWVKLATYEGQKKIKETSYDLWGLSVADVRFELAVAPGNPNVPVYYNRKEAEDFVHYNFGSFNATTPDPSAFELPKACQES